MFVLMVTVCAVTCAFAGPVGSSNAEVGQLAADEPPTCTITVKGTYDGKEINVTVTVEADNCARAAGDMLKAFAKK